MGLGRRIARLRMKKKESLQDVADAAGVSRAHIWELEKGRSDNPSMKLVTRLADHFGVSVSYLIGEDSKADDADVELARMFRQAQDLNEDERKILDDMMKSLVRHRGSRRKAG